MVLTFYLLQLVFPITVFNKLCTFQSRTMLITYLLKYISPTSALPYTIKRPEISNYLCSSSRQSPTSPRWHAGKGPERKTTFNWVTKIPLTRIHKYKKFTCYSKLQVYSWFMASTYVYVYYMVQRYKLKFPTNLKR